MALIAFIVGIPMFFEVGVVILIPVVLFAARRSKSPVVLLGIPALAGLSTLHAFVPPHPGPLTAIGALNANLGITLALGLIVAIPTVIISGPLFGRLAAKWVPIAAPENEAEAEAPKSAENRPSFGTALSVILLPVVLMLAASIVDLTGQNTTAWGRVIAFLGTRSWHCSSPPSSPWSPLATCRSSPVTPSTAWSDSPSAPWPASS